MDHINLANDLLRVSCSSTISFTFCICKELSIYIMYLHYLATHIFLNLNHLINCLMFVFSQICYVLVGI